MAHFFVRVEARRCIQQCVPKTLNCPKYLRPIEVPLSYSAMAFSSVGKPPRCCVNVTKTSSLHCKKDVFTALGSTLAEKTDPLIICCPIIVTLCLLSVKNAVTDSAFSPEISISSSYGKCAALTTGVVARRRRNIVPDHGKATDVLVAQDLRDQL